MVSYTSEPQSECDICHKNTEVLTDTALCPKRMKSSTALLQKLQSVQEICPFSKTSILVLWSPSLWIPSGESSQAMKLTTHLHLVSKCRRSGAIFAFCHMLAWHA